MKRALLLLAVLAASYGQAQASDGTDPVQRMRDYQERSATERRVQDAERRARRAQASANAARAESVPFQYVGNMDDFRASGNLPPGAEESIRQMNDVWNKDRPRFCGAPCRQGFVILDRFGRFWLFSDKATALSYISENSLPGSE